MKQWYKRVGLILSVLATSITGWGQTVLQSENFDACASPAGWTSNIVAGNDPWLFGANGASNIDGTCFVYFDDDALGSGAPASTAELESPVIDVSGVTGQLLLNFDYNFNGTPGSFEVQVFDGLTWQQVLFTDVDDCGTWGCTYPSAQIDVTPYANASFQVKFIYDDGGGSWAWYAGFDNYSLEEITCPPPSAGMGSNATATTADLSWTPGGTESFWNIEWGTPGFVPGTGAELGGATGLSSPMTTATGLTQGTTYEFYVLADCGGGDFSTWAGPFTFNTACPITPATVPLLEDFESYNGIYFGDNFIHCDANYFWEFSTDNQTEGRLRVGTDAYATNGGTGAATLDMDPSGSVTINYFTMTVDMSNYSTATNNMMLSFDWTEHGEESHPNDRVWIRGSNSDTWLQIYDWYANQGTNGVWTSVTQLNMTALLAANGQNFGPTTQIRFGQEDNFPAGSDGFSLDNVLIEENLCPDPSNLGTAFIGSTSTMITWTPGGSETAWNVEWGPTGFAQGTGTTIAATNDTVNITGLTAQTIYDFYVQADCGGNGTSNFIGPFTWTTACAAVGLPFTEDFTGTTTPACWMESGSEAWKYSTGAGYQAANAGDHTASGTTNYAWIDGSTPNGPSQISSLTTPFIDITGTNPAYLTYWVYSYNTDDNGNNTLIVEVWDGSQWNTINTIQQNFPQGWTQFGFILDNLNPTGDIQVKFTVIENSSATPYYNDILIDDINIDGNAPSCPAPTNVTTYATGTDSVNVTWMAGYNETSWIVEYGPAGFAQGTGTIVNATNDSITINGLSDGTEYDIYVQADCGVDSSSVLGPVSFITSLVNDDACMATYVPVDENVYVYSNLGATVQPNEPGTSPNNTIWFKFEVPASGHVGINTCGSTMDNELEAFTVGTCGDFNTYTSVGYADGNPFGCDINDAGIELCGLTPGDTIYFWVGPWSQDDFGDMSIKLFDLGASAGMDSVVAACETDTLNLWTELSAEQTHEGTWYYPSNPSAIMNDSMLVVSLMTFGNTDVTYIYSNSCFADTAVLTMDIYQTGNTGTAVTPYEVCNDGSESLFNGLTGNVDIGGTWNDDDATGRLNGSILDVDSLATGNYDFTYTVNNGVCPTAQTTVTMTVLNCTGIDEHNAGSFLIYPNPSNGQFAIENRSMSDELTIRIVDVRGKLVFSDRNRVDQGGRINVDLTNNEAGVYFIQIRDSETTYNYRVIVE